MKSTRSKTGMTLVETMITIVIISGVGLAIIPGIYFGKRVVAKSRLKQICNTAIQNKLKDYRTSKIWGASDASLGGNPYLNGKTNHPSGPYSVNSTFNWLIARYAAVTANSYQGCVDYNDPLDVNNLLGIRENLDNHGGPNGTSSSNKWEVPADACPEELASKCQGPGPTDQAVANELAGNAFAIFTNLQYVSREPAPNPYSKYYYLKDGKAIADIYAGQATYGPANDQIQFTPSTAAGTSGCTGTYGNPPVYTPPSPCPINGSGSSKDIVHTNGTNFQEMGSAIRIVVTGAITLPDSGNNPWNLSADIKLPDGSKTNRDLMCQAEEIIAPEEPMFRYYYNAKANRIYNLRGENVFPSITSPKQVPNTNPVIAFTVAPNNSSVFAVLEGSQNIRLYTKCGFGANPNIDTSVLDCDPDYYNEYPLSQLGIPIGLDAMYVDFVNFPDIVTARLQGSDMNFVDLKIDTQNPSLCGFFNPSVRLKSSRLNICAEYFNVSERLGAVIVSPLNSILFYVFGEGLYLSSDCQRTSKFYDETLTTSLASKGGADDISAVSQ